MDAKEKQQGPQPEKKATKGKEALKSFTDSPELASRMGRIRHKIMVLSGKGGVGKSTVAANIAIALALEGKKVGLLDADFHGPSIPTLLNLNDRRPTTDGKSIVPIEFSENVKVMSIGFLLPKRDDAVIWRGPMKMGVLKQLLGDVEWGELDYLVIDFPPGTGDEPLSVAQLIPSADGAVIVTTPQDLSVGDVKKCINFCRQLHLPVLGVVENMSGLVCPNCKTVINVFKAGGGEKMATEMNVPFLGRIPIEPTIVEASDNGTPFIYHYSETEAGKAFATAIQPLLNLPERKKENDNVSDEADGESIMTTIAIPLSGGVLAEHFGHCDEFAFYTVDLEARRIIGSDTDQAPSHEPGLLPQWIEEKGARVIIAGGMGTRAQELLASKGITVTIGAPEAKPEDLIADYLAGTLKTGDNICSH